MAAVVAAIGLLFSSSCADDHGPVGPDIGVRDSLPVIKSKGVSTLISDSGIVRYKVIAEEWYMYDKKDPTYWAFEKGLFLEQYDRQHHVEAFISCDTAYYYDQRQLMEMRGRVLVKNLQNETFKTELLFYDMQAERFYSKAYMEIDTEDNKLSGYDFSSNKAMTDYRIHSSKGQFPLEDDKHSSPTPTPAPMPMPQPENSPLQEL